MKGPRFSPDAKEQPQTSLYHNSLATMALGDTDQLTRHLS